MTLLPIATRCSTVSQPGAKAPHMADRHGRKPKAAAAAARDHSRSSGPGPSFNACRAGGRCLDALRHRHRRTWHSNRREGPVGREAAGNCTCGWRSATEARGRTIGRDRDLRRRPPKKRFFPRSTRRTSRVSVQRRCACDGPKCQSRRVRKRSMDLSGYDKTIRPRSQSARSPRQQVHST